MKLVNFHITKVQVKIAKNDFSQYFPLVIQFFVDFSFQRHKKFVFVNKYQVMISK